MTWNSIYDTDYPEKNILFPRNSTKTNNTAGCETQLVYVYLKSEQNQLSSKVKQKQIYHTNNIPITC